MTPIRVLPCRFQIPPPPLTQNGPSSCLRCWFPSPRWFQSPGARRPHPPPRTRNAPTLCLRCWFPAQNPPPRREAPPKDAGDGWEMVAFPAALWNRREAPGAIIRLPARGATPPEGAKSSARRCNADLVWLGRVGRFTSACVHWGCFLAKILFEHRSERIHSIWRKWGRPTPPDFSQLCVFFAHSCISWHRSTCPFLAS